MSKQTPPVERQPDDKQTGKFHYNPGNMSGKQPEEVDKGDEQMTKDESEKRAESDKRRPDTDKDDGSCL